MSEVLNKMNPAVCDFCGQAFKPVIEGQNNYLQVLRVAIGRLFRGEKVEGLPVAILEVRPSQFQREIEYRNLFMCHDCYDRLQTNVAYNARNFKVEKCMQLVQ